MNDSEYARFHTEQRVGLTKGNPKELEQWANVFIFDIYAMVAELQKDDPKNLYDRLTQIKDADLPGVRRQGAVHPGNRVQWPDGSRPRYHHAVHVADDECG